MRHRWMYYATGMPGWMRLGYSPGWVGRSPSGVGPCASYLITGQWPMPPGPPSWGTWPEGGLQSTAYAPADELSMLKSQADWLRSQLDGIVKRVEELEKEG